MTTKALEPVIEQAIKSGDWSKVETDKFATMTDFQRLQAMEAANKRLLTPEQLEALSKAILSNARKMATAVRKGVKAVNAAERDAAVEKAVRAFYAAVEDAYGTGVSYLSLSMFRVENGDPSVKKIIVKSPSRSPFAVWTNPDADTGETVDESTEVASENAPETDETAAEDAPASEETPAEETPAEDAPEPVTTGRNGRRK